MEIAAFVRYFGIILISLFVYTRILNIKDLPKTKILTAVIFALAVGVLLSNRLPFSHVIVLISVCVFVSVAIGTLGGADAALRRKDRKYLTRFSWWSNRAKAEKGFIISVAVISTGIGLGLEVLGLLILIIVESTYFIIYMELTGEILSMEEIAQNPFIASPIIAEIFILLISICSLKFLSKIKRLKKGFIFWENKNVMRIGMIISIFIITARILLGAISFLARSFYIEDLIEIVLSSYPYSIILIFSIYAFINACLIGIYLWWRHHITLLYREKQKERIIEEQRAEIDERDRRIERLIKSNDFLSKAVHRDNKLIPAMYNAVNSFLSSPEATQAKARGTNIRNELEEIMQERKDMIMQIQREHKALPTTEIERIDAILNYMLIKAAEKNIEFDFIPEGSIKDIAESAVSKHELETLLADLIENAIIAASYSERKRVLVTMGAVDNCLEINIWDSAPPFEAEILTSLGIEKATTHANTGGSGIGYLTIFEILKECGASLTITEHTPEDCAFTKSIKIRFDGIRPPNLGV